MPQQYLLPNNNLPNKFCTLLALNLLLHPGLWCQGRSGVFATTFTLFNKCKHLVWPGIQPIADRPMLANGGFRLMPLPSVRLSIAARVPMAVPKRAGLLLSLVSLRMPVPELTVMPMTIQAAWLHALGLTISSPSVVIDNNAANTFQRGLSGCSF